jgi:hypothetical protein
MESNGRPWIKAARGSVRSVFFSTYIQTDAIPIVVCQGDWMAPVKHDAARSMRNLLSQREAEEKHLTTEQLLSLRHENVDGDWQLVEHHKESKSGCVWNACRVVCAPLITLDEMRLVHSEEHIRKLAHNVHAAQLIGGPFSDPRNSDLFYSPGTLEAARLVSCCLSPSFVLVSHPFFSGCWYLAFSPSAATRLLRPLPVRWRN